MRALSQTRESVAEPSQPHRQYTKEREKEQTNRQFWETKPLRLRKKPLRADGGAQWMWLPSIAPSASRKYGQNLGLLRM